MSELAKYCQTLNPIATHFYFGTDDHPKSKAFIEDCQKLDWNVTTKPVKYINGKRKCDFDVEVVMTALLKQEKYETLILMSGDGDYAALYEYLLKQGKRVFIVYPKRTLGKEIFTLEDRCKEQQVNRPITVDIQKLPIIRKSPNQ